MANIGRLQPLLNKAKRGGWAHWIKNCQDENAVLQGCYFDLQRAQAPVDFFENLLVHSKGRHAGEPFTLLPWQKTEFLMPLMGWQRAEGTRRFRRFYTELPKKNGKSTLAAGLELYMLIGDGEQGAEVYSAANDKSQAGIVHNHAAEMVRASPALSKRLDIIDYTKTIRYGTKAWIRALSADVPTKEGIDAHFVIVDELHAFKIRTLFDTLEHSGAARRQPLFGIITTAGDNPEGVCFQEHEAALKVIEGAVLDPSLLALIYAADPGDPWDHEATFAKANPSYGHTITRDNWVDTVQAAHESAEKESNFKRYRLNLWISGSDKPWMPMQEWGRCGLGEPFSEADLLGLPCWSGLDLATTTDLAALVHVFPRLTAAGLRKYRVLARFWCPEERVREVSQLNIARYLEWKQQGWLTATPGAVIDYDWIMHQIELDLARFRIQMIAFDRHGATQMMTKLDQNGVPVAAFGQGFLSMSPPTKELYNLVKGERIEHGNNPILTWMASNVTVLEDPAGNIKPVKKVRNRGHHKKIDGIVALIMGIDGALRAEGTDGEQEIELLVLK